MVEDIAKPSEFIKFFDYALKAIFGDHVPFLVTALIGTLLLAVALSAALAAILVAIAKVKDIWAEKLRPLSYSPEEKKRSRNSRLFANHVLREINQRNLSENWKDEEFAELEGEVEAQGQRRYLLPFKELFRAPTGIRREPSLTRALERSSERLILLEGDPGSGKSVALRHVTQNIAIRASKAQQSNSILPIFVNLKELRCDEDETVNRDLIRKFILQSLNRINDRFIDEFLEAEFDQGLQDGRWVFLFDSFDEIPAVLSSTEADAVIQRYSEAISDFLGGLNSCRGVVASRFYRGPSQAGWQKFRIMDLSSERQEDLIDKALLSPAVTTRLRGELALANNDIQSIAKNPMLLGLLCEHMRLGNDFPALAYEVFEKYFSYRFERDAERVMQRYDLAADVIQKEAEQLAFAMANSSVLGLSPSRKLLHHTLNQMGMKWSEKRLNRLLDALEYMKIGRSDRDGVSTDERQFTFSHRRFQEYFSTCIVIRNPEAVTSKQLLLDARWRETAVVLCQTGRSDAVHSLLVEAKEIISKACEQVEAEQQRTPPEAPADVSRQPLNTFVWPEGVLHVLSILQAGFGSTKREMPDELRQAAASIIQTATTRGSLLDRKFALEVAGVAPQETLLELIRQALQLDSQWLNDVIYRQVARLSTIPPDVLVWVRTAILRVALGQGARRRRDGLHAHLTRLYRSSDLLDALRLAYAIRPIDLIIALALSVFLFMTPLFLGAPWLVSLPILGFVIVMYTLVWRLYGWTQFETTHFMRIYMCVLLIGFALGLKSNWLAWPYDWRAWACLGSIYFLSWSAAATGCVKYGMANGVLYWPFIPLYSLSRMRHLRIVRVFLSKAGIAIIGFYSAFGILLYFLWDIVSEIVGIASIVFSVLMGIGLMVFLGKLVFHVGRDYRAFLEMKQKISGHIEASELCDQYRRFSTGIFKFRFLNFVRTQGLLSRSSNIAVLREFAEEVSDDNVRAGTARKSVLLRLWSFFDFGVSSYKLERRDEIYILIEDLMKLGSVSQVAFQAVGARQFDLDQMNAKIQDRR